MNNWKNLTTHFSHLSGGARAGLALPLILFLLAACASLGTPDGGIYDEIPPKMVSSSPAMFATQVDKRKISILFDEYIKLDRPSEKVMVSPPQLEPANIQADGKRVKVTLYDTLQSNTTYTIDFGDAIEDNNEGNPMGFFTYTFSTGNDVDTMEIGGMVLNAEDLDPVKGILVGAYVADSTFNDSILRQRPFLRVARTNGEGRFVIKGVKHGRYRIMALDDKDGDLRFSQKSERVAFDTVVYLTSQAPDLRMDTVWRDTTHFDSINVVPYTHYYPDDIILRAFLEAGQDQHLLKTERPDPDLFRLYFTAPADTLPVLRGLNFDERCLVVQPSLHNDTITYWVTDTMYSCQQDTLTFQLSYLDTDTAGILVSRTDTLELVPRLTHKKRAAERQKQIDDWEKQRAKKIKRSKKPLTYEENPYLHIPLELKVEPTAISPSENVTFLSPEPLLSVDTAHVHFYVKKDTDWLPAPFLFLPVERNVAAYRLYAEWAPKGEYRFVADSAAFCSVLGKTSKPLKKEIRVRGDEEFGAIFIHAILPDTGVVVQLLNRSGKVLEQRRADKDGRADFFYLRAGSYYLRCFIDVNGNNEWDTGSYLDKQQPEEVFYFPKPLVLRAQWDLEQEWDVRGIALNAQKPSELVKQKADKKKTVKQRNREREMKRKDPNYREGNDNQRNRNQQGFGF